MALLATPPSEENFGWALSVLGRALYLACEFESTCRSLTFVFKVKEPKADDQSDEESFLAMRKAVLGRLVDLNRLIAKHTSLGDDYVAMLHSAREARNYIAHHAAGELKQFAKEPGGVDQWRKCMDSKLQELALGKIIVAVILSRNSAEPTPTRGTIDAYPKSMVSWVLNGDA